MIVSLKLKEKWKYYSLNLAPFKALKVDINEF